MEMNTLIELIKNGATECPDGVDANLFDTLVKVYGKKPETVTIEATGKEVSIFPEHTAPLTQRPLNGKEFTLDDMEEESETVGWISTANGISRIGDDKIKLTEEGFKATLIGEKTRIAKGIRVQNPANASEYKYYKTYNGVTTRDGESWDNIVAKAKALNPNAWVYTLMECVLRVDEAVKSSNGKDVVVVEGDKISYSNPPSLGKYMKTFANDCSKKGFDVMTDEVPVIVRLGSRTKKDTGNEYQVVELIPQ